MRQAAFAFTLALAAAPASAVLVSDNQPGWEEEQFRERLRTALAELEHSKDPLLRRLYAALVAAPGSIRIRPMTDDKATWSNDGDRKRGHTEPADKLPKSRGRTKPSDAISFVPADAVVPGEAHWNSGTLAHELTHALDLATGRYNRDDPIRERRATFMQNAWRAQTGFALRVAYHGRFSTLDWQESRERGTQEEYARYLFTRNDFPPAPKTKGKPGKDNQDE